jgi:REP element-mobilizing transposase RayT
MADFVRKALGHQPPDWVDDGATYFITVCCDPRGTNHLCSSGLAGKILESVAMRQHKGEWMVSLLLLMPDHLHALISFNTRDHGIAKVMQNWKRYLARFDGISWQRGFFDHRLRSDDAFREKGAYIRHNPVRAGLCESVEDWPYLWDARKIAEHSKR